MISCPIKQTLRIKNAVYGNNWDQVCGGSKFGSCKHDITDQVQNNCDTRETCQLKALPSEYGGVCEKGSYNALQVVYSCLNPGKDSILFSLNTTIDKFQVFIRHIIIIS